MPIINLDDLEDEEIIAEPVRTKKTFIPMEESKTSVMFSEDKQLDGVIQNISGLKWTVDYFVQIRGANDGINNPDINVPATIQKYNRINKLVLFLDSGIDQSSPEEITGSGVINAGFMPSNGDPFFADVTGGRNGMFVITNVEKKQYGVHSSYSVEFKLFAFMDTDTLIFNNVIKKTMREYYYDKTSFLDFSAPVIVKDDYIKKLSYRDSYSDILEYYLSTFIDSRGLISLPVKNNVYYDQYLMKFIERTIDVSTTNYSTELNRVTVELDSKDDIYTLISEREIKRIKYANKDLKFSSIRLHSPTISNITHIGIKYAVFVNPDVVKVIYSESMLPIALNTEDDITKPTNSVEHYVFSEAFYNNDKPNCTEFETMLLSYLEHKIIPTNKLAKLVEEYRYWDALDQFYLLPIVLLFIKDGIRNTFKSI